MFGSRAYAAVVAAHLAPAHNGEKDTPVRTIHVAQRRGLVRLHEPWIGTTSHDCGAPDFTIARRGYDKHEVDKFLEQLVDWLETDAAQDIGEVAVTRKLERVGESTAHILLTTEQEAQKLKRQTEEDCAQLRAQAEADAQKLRAAAADDARRAREEATAEATETIEEGLRRRGQIDDQIHELEDHRAALLDEPGRLRVELSATIDAHPPTPAKQNGEPDRNAPDAEPASRANAQPQAH